MSGLLITIIGGVVVGFIVLVLDYGIFRKRRQPNKNNSLPSSPTDGKIANKGPELIIIDDSITWPEAIHKAVENFRILHEGKAVEILSTDTTVEFAGLLIEVSGTGPDGLPPLPSAQKHYFVRINKRGEILTIKTQ